MPTGPCRLCGETRDLQDSHFIPAAFYNLLKTLGARHSNPIVMNPRLQIETSAQVRAHMLCRACEERLNRGGERWVLANCWRTYTEFPLREVLCAATPVERSPRFAAYAGAAIPGVDVDRLTYFGASVFWRGGLHGWRNVGGHVPIRLDFGRYEDELRLFLLGEGAFPADMVLTVVVTGATEAVPHRAVTFPYLKGRDPEARYRHYRFVVLGISFELLVGNRIPAAVRALCSVRSPSRLVYVVTETDRLNITDALRLFAKGRPAGRLRR